MSLPLGSRGFRQVGVDEWASVSGLEIESKNVSVCGQNIIIIETYPENISELCPGFTREYSNCGLSHPKLDPYRQAVLICNVGVKLFYLAYGLDIYVHAGTSIKLCQEYIVDLKRKGYVVVTLQEFDLEEKHILVVGSNESAEVSGKFWFYNYGSPQFTPELDTLFDRVNFLRIIEIMTDEKLMESCSNLKKNSRGQPVLIDFNYSIQNCTDGSDGSGINLPKLSKIPQEIVLESGETLAHIQLEIMTEVTQFLTKNWSDFDILGDDVRQQKFGGSIGEKISHPNLKFVKKNGLEGNALGTKKPGDAYFNTHIDNLNSKFDRRYRYTAVMSSVVEKDGNYYFPFTICYNRRGCESRMTYMLNVRNWLKDIKDYLAAISEKDLKIDGSLLVEHKNIEHLVDQPSTLKVVKRGDTYILHRTPHANKHVQLSSFVDNLHYAVSKLSWWKHHHTIEYLYFVGLSCTPVSSWYSLRELILVYADNEPQECLTIILIQICLRRQAGIDRTTGHRYSPSAGKSMPRNYLFWSLKNLATALKTAETTSDTEQIVRLIAKHPSKGGCYKLGHISALEVVSVYTLAGYCRDRSHATSAIVCEGNKTTKFLETRYGFTASQRKHLLDIAMKEIDNTTLAILENVNCKMGQQWDNKTVHHCDTLFEEQCNIYTVQDNKIKIVGRTTVEWMIENGYNKAMPTLRKHWYNVTAYDWIKKGIGEDIAFVTEKAPDPIKTVLLFNNKHGSVTKQTQGIHKCKQRQPKRQRNGTFVTKFQPQPIEKIQKQMFTSKSNKMLKVKMKSENKQYGKKLTTTISQNKFPSYSNLNSPQSSKIIDFEHWCSYLLGIGKEDISSSITYTRYRHKNVSGMTWEYWDANFCNDIIDVKVYLSQAQFCFDYDNSIVKPDDEYCIYKKKTMAKHHLLLLLVLKIDPSVITKSFMRGTDNPVIIHANLCGKSQKVNVEYSEDGKTKDVCSLPGWIVLFKIGKRVCAIDSSKAKFNKYGAACVKDFSNFIHELIS